MMLSVIAAVGRNRELGKNNTLLWNIPEDMAWFREKTKGHPVIMGRKTFESIGRPLPKRLNIVVTKNLQFYPDGVTVAHSLDKAIEKAKETRSSELFIIGGAHLYAQAVPIADKLYITEIDAAFPDADAFFPVYTSRFTKEIFTNTIQSSSGYTMTFKILTP
jgi:dihydrofolate reductase